MPGQPLHVAVQQFRRGHTAAIGASKAIDLRLDLLRNSPQAALDVAVGFQEAAETLILTALVLAKTPDLDQVRDHQVTFTFLKSPARM
jgi:hypothetical protein